MTAERGPMDFLADAVNRVINGGETLEQAVTWVFHRGMSDRDRLRFDGFLVKMNDELAYQAGTTESRFRERVRRMVKLQQTGEL